MSSQKKTKKKVKINPNAEDGPGKGLLPEGEKPKKVKVTYYDDNSTVIDMSYANRKGEKREPPKKRTRAPSTAKEKRQTFWTAFRKMLIPMFVALIILAVIFLALYGIGRCAAA